MKSSFGQIKALNSVRGLAALIVVFAHFAGVFYPAAIHGSSQVIHTRFDINIYQTPLMIFFAGTFAVIIFFILSGFVLTVKYLSHQQKSLFSSAVKRYFRLMPVAFVSVIIAYILLASGLMVASQTVGYSGADKVATEFQVVPNLAKALAQGTVGIFTMESSGVKFYNPVLWTLYYELLGSLLVFGLAMMCRGQPKRWLLYGIAAVALVSTYFVGFVIGLILADIYATKPDWYKKVRDTSVWYKVGLLALAFCIAGFPGHPPESAGNYWSMLIMVQENMSLSRTLLQVIAGAIIIVLALSWVRLRSLLEIKPLLWLGKISFTLYAIHYIFIYSFTCQLFLIFIKHYSYNISTILSLAVSLVIMMVIAEILHRYVELPSINVANKIGKWSEK